MTNNLNQQLIIKDWQEAIADSPSLGFGLIRNADIDSYPGAVASGFYPATNFLSLTTRTFTADASTDVCIASGSLGLGNFVGQAVTFSSSGTLPAGLTAGVTYFLIYLTATTFKVATTLQNANAGTAINITDAGTGTHTVTQVPLGTVRSSCYDSRGGTMFFHDSNGRVWFKSGYLYLLNGNTLTNSSGKGIITFRTSDGSKTYLFAFRNAAIDVVDVTTTANKENPSWSNAWQTLNSSAGSVNSHYSIVGQDNIIYFVDNRYVGSIQEKAGSVFDPATAGTYTYNNQALDMPQDEINEWLDELGVQLLICGVTYNKIYPWDRVSDSYNLPINVPENNVYRIKNIGGVVYILAGSKGNIYTTQGTYVRLFKTIPKYISYNSSMSIQSVTWGGIGIKSGGLLFGASVQESNNSGVYLLYPDGRLVVDNMPLSGSAAVSTILSLNDAYYMGYAGGVDNVDTSTRNSATTYRTVIQSKLYNVGNKTQKSTYSEIEVQTLTTPSSGTIRIKYRTKQISTWSDFPAGAVSFSADGSTSSFNADIGLIDIENLQIQIEMDGEFVIDEVRLIP